MTAMSVIAVTTYDIAHRATKIRKKHSRRALARSTARGNHREICSEAQTCLSSHESHSAQGAAAGQEPAQAAPAEGAIHEIRAEVYQHRRTVETSLMSKGIFGSASNESQDKLDSD